MADSHGEFYRGVEAASRSAPPGADPAHRAAAALAALDALLVPDAWTPPRACRPGCAHCCSFPVGIAFGEALLLAAAIAGNAEVRRRIAAETAATAALADQELVGRPCPLLVDAACAAYAARPAPCRALASADAAACERALSGDPDVPRDEAAYWRGLGVAHWLAADVPAGRRELRAALAAVLAAAGDPAAAFAAARPAPGTARDAG
jgi:hypothetical protein